VETVVFCAIDDSEELGEVVWLRFAKYEERWVEKLRNVLYARAYARGVVRSEVAIWWRQLRAWSVNGADFDAVAAALEAEGCVFETLPVERVWRPRPGWGGEPFEPPVRRPGRGSGATPRPRPEPPLPLEGRRLISFDDDDC
jgi:hypothetical protein